MKAALQFGGNRAVDLPVDAPIIADYRAHLIMDTVRRIDTQRALFVVDVGVISGVGHPFAARAIDKFKGRVMM